MRPAFVGNGKPSDKEISEPEVLELRLGSELRLPELGLSPASDPIVSLKSLSLAAI